jgi:hypothetical protein
MILAGKGISGLGRMFRKDPFKIGISSDIHAN